MTDFTNIISLAFDAAVAKAVAPLVEHINSLEQKINLLEDRQNTHLGTPHGWVPAARVDALYDLLGTLIETDDEAVEHARGDIDVIRFRMRDALLKFLRAEIVDYASDEFASAVIDVVESDTVTEKLLESVRALRDEKIKDAVETALENGNFTVDYRRY